MRTRNQDQEVPPLPPRGGDPGGSVRWSWSWFLVLMASCGPSSNTAPEAPAAADVEIEKIIALQFGYDATLLKPGHWALYRLKIEGSPRTEIHKWSVVQADAKGIWVENKIPHLDTGAIRKSRYDRSGKLLEIWVGPPGGVPAKAWPNANSPSAPPARAVAPPAFQESAEPAAAAGRVFRCTKLASQTTYPDGRPLAVASWYSPEVPFAGQARYGGLVRRTVGRVTMELLDSGQGLGRPELEIPK